MHTKGKSKEDFSKAASSSQPTKPTKAHKPKSSKSKPANLPQTTHYCYLRAHSGSSTQGGLPTGRTLFVVNLPAVCGERELRDVVGRWGVVERIVWRGDELHPDSDGEDKGEEAMADEDDDDDDMEETRKPQPSALPSIPPLPSLPSIPHATSLSAHVVFLDPSSLTRALQAHPPIPLRPLALGLTHYLALHAALRPSLPMVRKHADAYIAAWETREEEKRRAQKVGVEHVDADGFTLVTRGGRHGRASAGGVGVASRSFELQHRAGAEQLQKKKRARRAAGVVPDFYRFQLREKKREEFIKLRKVFEEDKKKVNKMREERRFRPY
ncbi:hypothetical protein DACRYDRAFT_92542 [Dacryopinax primogenitus]|uniref:RRM domain-containing protein n=1 Tax=Dacryopinax primogenitus (strain DJM 731) TaxID=1858805 RepID=M5GFV6_DACPD|nr:uncharacterized protein DACRYDRAFT_92542 [Dacryopinax primogenitus]EJU06617.1 hypothetical protein DACRYDRAFT_92542 [Dacryopinax primogenitus]